MIQQPLISVIVPSYNVEKYLERCFKAFLDQTYKNLEIILVNDASTDNTGILCDEFAESHSFVKVLHNAKNGGLSVARNVGLDHATGKYIGFIDPDDDFSPDFFEKFYNFSVLNNCDIVICGRCQIYQKKEKATILHSEKNQVLDKNEVMQMLFNDTLGSQAWEKFFKKDLWDGIRFIPGRIYAEDVAIMHLVFDRAQRIGSIAEPLYYYYVNDATLTTTFRPFKWMSLYLAFKERLEFAEMKYPEMIEELQIKTIGFARLTLDNYLQKRDQCDEPYMNEIIERVTKNRKKALKSPYMKWYNKLVILFYCCSPKLYARSVKYIHKLFYYFKPNYFR